MVLWGALVNAAAILGGALLGLLVKFPDQMRRTIMHGLGLAVMLIGISMGLETDNVLIPIASLAIGSILGELLNLEGAVERLGSSLASRTTRLSGRSGPHFTQGFLTATLVYCVGAMAVIGSLNSGLQLDHQVLYAKSMLDGISAIFFAASFGLGVAFSALPVFAYQGAIALLATSIAPILSELVIQELTATGGLLILGIGCNILGITKLAVGNMLPSLVIAVLLSLLF